LTVTLISPALGVSSTVSVVRGGESLAFSSSIEGQRELGVSESVTADVGNVPAMRHQRSVSGAGSATIASQYGANSAREDYSVHSVLSAKEASMIKDGIAASFSPDEMNLVQLDRTDGAAKIMMDGETGMQRMSQASSSSGGSLVVGQSIRIDDGLAAASVLSSEKDLTESHTLANKRGDQVMVTAKVTGGSSSYKWTKSATSTQVKLTESLKTNGATSIACVGSALNAEMEAAVTNAIVEDSSSEGSIVYSNDVRAGTSGSSVTEKIAAKGEKIIAGAIAFYFDGSTDDSVDSRPSASTTMRIDAGQLSATIGATAYGDKKGRSASQKVTSSVGAVIRSSIDARGRAGEESVDLDNQVLTGRYTSTASSAGTATSSAASNKYSMAGEWAEKTSRAEIVDSYETVTAAYSKKGSLSSTDAVSTTASSTKASHSVKGSSEASYALIQSRDLKSGAIAMTEGAGIGENGAGSIASVMSGEAGQTARRVSGTFQGDGTEAWTYAKAASSDAFADSNAYSYKGSLKVSHSADASATGLAVSQTVDGSGDIMKSMVQASNQGRTIYSASGTTVSSGSLKATDRAAYGSGRATTYNSISGKGAKIDVVTVAANDRAAKEYAGDTLITVPYGGGQFMASSASSLTAKVAGTADAATVLITPSTSLKKTAIILEPYSYICENLVGATGLGKTVLPTLAGAGYATLRYTDSAAVKERFMEIDDYNVVLVVSHMNPTTIGLTTDPWYISSQELDSWYDKPPADSMVVLTGCSSFKGYPSESGLAKSVAQSGVRGGFVDNVYILWAHDYMAELFSQMASGKTASVANSFVISEYEEKWLAEHPGWSKADLQTMVLYGNGDVAL
jgi:hypothetical protein